MPGEQLKRRSSKKGSGHCEPWLQLARNGSTQELEALMKAFLRPAVASVMQRNAAMCPKCASEQPRSGPCRAGHVLAVGVLVRPAAACRELEFKMGSTAWVEP